MAQAPIVEGPWYVSAFGRFYLHLYAHRDDAEAAAHAPLLCSLLGVGIGDRVLDVACGAGRHCRALARRGIRATGVDLSEDLLAEARAASPGLPGAPTYVRGDVRRLPFVRQFEGALSMFTSFGYFDERADDVAVMAGVCRALVPGGRFVLDFLNEAHVRANLEPVTEEVRDGVRVRIRRRIDDAAPGGPRVCKHVEAESVASRLVSTRYEEQVCLYTADEVDALLVDAGLVPVGERLGDFDRRPFGAASTRLLRVAERPGRRR